MKMPFGKFSGLAVQELPDWYLDWLFEKAEISNHELSAAIEEEWILRNRAYTDQDDQEGPSGDHKELDPYCRAIVEAGFRELEKRWHPDAGGSHTKMVQCVKAIEFLRAMFASEPAK